MKLFLRNSFLSLIISVCFCSQANSQFLTTGNGTTTVGSAGLVCLGDFLEPLNMNTPALTDWVDFRLAAGLGCSYWIHSSLDGVADAGTYAGFHLRSIGLLSLLGGVEVRTYLSGQFQESASGASLLSLLAGEEGDIYFTTTKPYNELRLVVSSLLGLAYNINIFYGFGSRDLPNTIVLPLDILDFSAQRAFDAIEINCRLASDEEIQTVTIEHSSDGLNFQPVATGMGSPENNYSFRIPANAQTFYRAKIVTSSRTYYSAIASVPVAKTIGQMQVLSQGGQAYLRVPSSAGARVSVALHDLAGRTYYNKSHNLNGQTQINLPAGLSKGSIYFVTVIAENGVKETKKFLL